MPSDPFTILLVDDEQSQREILAGFLRKQRFTVLEAASAEEALAVFGRQTVDLVLSDFRMPGRSGAELLRDLRLRNAEVTVVLMTAFGTIEGAVAAMRDGAYDYLTKPVDLDELNHLIGRIRERTALLSENRILKQQLAERSSFSGIIANSPAMQAALSTAARVADSGAPVLIRGESGTGKELIARALHYNSARRDKPFVAVNSAALNEHLLESELFGHERGAFTGADRQHRGRFEMASGGTIFLDEIGEIPPATQVKLLRVLQEQRFERVGGNETIAVDVRVVAATNRDLEAAIRAQSFREDLFYRLNVIPIDLPPLRKRREDIPALLDHFLAAFAKEHARRKLAFSREAWDLLLRYDYPGNIRELQNIVQRAVLLSRRETITTDELPPSVRQEISEAGLPPDVSTLPQQVERLEKELILEALRRSTGNQSQAAKQLGIPERNLRYRLKKWKIKGLDD